MNVLSRGVWTIRSLSQHLRCDEGRRVSAEVQETENVVETAPLHFNIELDDRPPILVGALTHCKDTSLLRYVSTMLQPSLITAVQIQRVCV